MNEPQACPECLRRSRLLAGRECPGTAYYAAAVSERNGCSQAGGRIGGVLPG